MVFNGIVTFLNMQLIKAGKEYSFQLGGCQRESQSLPTAYVHYIPGSAVAPRHFHELKLTCVSVLLSGQSYKIQMAGTEEDVLPTHIVELCFCKEGQSHASMLGEGRKK